ncbi:3-oxoacyl-ACP synthase [Fulvivirgaceae bacterium BMA10]|uniref:3-oxoacyl-ACP synthase n=2 Tax=Splendidivirga corallicola TaxID=3051826 RepID=A0ABT8KUM3_9BACT|nr:3-oxoacyl-ACP synthase [Fulvivirgaceae bacterium BMA10]
MNEEMLKRTLWNTCLEKLDKRINNAQAAVDRARQSANGESKSSVGDKYETSRAMGHLDQDMYAKQLDEALKVKKLLLQLDPDKRHESVEAGSLIKTNKGYFYLAVGIGEITIKNEKFFVISPLAPIAQAMLGKKAMDKIQFNKQDFIIEEIS